MAITVIDSMMGTGKTQAMYKTIRENPNKSYIVVTPYKSTVKDVINAVPNMYQPVRSSTTKMENLEYLLSHGCNIACTHSLFLNTTDAIWDLIRNGEYTLFIDEALDVVKEINDIIRDSSYHVRVGTAKFLKREGTIEIDECCRVTWTGGSSEEDYEYKWLEPIIRSGNVMCAGERLFLWVFPPEAFSAFSDVFILSYMFKGSIFDTYLNAHGFSYTVKGVSGSYGSEEGFYFTEYKEDSDVRKALKPLITIYDGKANDIGNKTTALSASWMKKSNPEDTRNLKTAFNTFVKKAKAHMPEGKLMWTVVKDRRDSLTIYGTKNVRRLSKDEAAAMKADQRCKNRELNRLRCFVPCNAKGVGDYADRSILAYLCNRFYNPLIKRMFMDVYGVEIDEKRFALSEMIQWMWRSRIRKSDLPDEERKIIVYVPSRRMRVLLQRWLDGEEI